VKSSQAERPSSCCATLRRAFFGSLIGLFLIVITAWVARDALLRGAAWWWIVADQPEAADVVAIFGGSPEERPIAAAAYYRQGLVKRIVISNSHVTEIQRRGVVPPESVQTRMVLMKLGVPEEAIAFFGEDLASTYDEALALKLWAKQEKVQSIIAPTEIFTTRRASWVLRHVLGPEVKIIVPALEPSQYGADSWWRNHVGIVDFQNEVLKYVFYRLTY